MRISDWSSDVCASYLPVGPDDELDHDAPVVGAASSLDLISFSSLRKLAISPRSACSRSSSMPRLTAIGFGFVTAQTKTIGHMACSVKRLSQHARWIASVCG